MLSLIYVVVLGCSLCCLSNAGWSAFTCVGQEPWEVTAEDNSEATKIFQNWILFRQNRCINTTSIPFWVKTQPYGGLGSHLTASVADLLKATELGHIYFPMAGYVWGYGNQSRCSRGIRAVDCYNLPLTLCTPNKPLLHYPSEINVTSAVEFHDGPSDICVVTKKLKKTILWTMGQVYLYHIRLPPVLNHEFEAEYKMTMKILKSAKPKRKENKCVTTAIHVRTGHLDFGRRPFDGSEHIDRLQQMNKDLQTHGKEICSVFVATSDPNATIFANATLGRLSPMHGFDILIMPRFLGNTSLEMEQQIFFYALTPGFRTDRLYVEYLLDMRIIGGVDIFLGSHSNMLVFANGIRAALHPEFPNNQTCFLDSRYPGAPMSCMGTMGMLKFLRDAAGGFNGGSLYFHWP